LKANVKKCVDWFNAWPDAPETASAIPEAGVIGSFPTKMVDDVEDIWKNVKVSDRGKWIEKAAPPSAAAQASVGMLKDGGKVSAGANGFGGEGPDRAFDGKPDSKYCVGSPTMWLQYQYPGNAKAKVVSYSITSANDSPERDPKDWKLLGSNDGKEWKELDSRSGENFAKRFDKKTFEVKNPGEYSIYKLDVTANHGTGTSQLGELEFHVK